MHQVTIYNAEQPSAGDVVNATSNFPAVSAGENTRWTTVELDRIIEMAWEDRTPFEAIRFQFGLNESGVRQLMKRQLRPGSYKLWRKRVEACNTKHGKFRSQDIDRFRCSRQRAISNNKVSKRM